MAVLVAESYGGWAFLAVIVLVTLQQRDRASDQTSKMVNIFSRAYQNARGMLASETLTVMAAAHLA
jgi:hypothetical protein